MLSIFLNLLPILLLVGVWIVFAIILRKGSPVQRKAIATQDEALEEARRTRIAVERIAELLEARQAERVG
ncbi:hypothetical protein DMC25_10760 [Caulobacter sp. D4A]|uniref:hypothetical protein n=1 Tax=unclassified Caulobacter TaxID=2648921 RepID=UPI000D73B756|nr:MULTISPECIES: hypothetical protein [unclassified Caulobacter]PXA88640.1 hypothetical protein DMC25_10760 [Caulobacter sp. D4A]PXA90015.1 hypothetical protein DMC18_15615 [Caulobacter sp. D5]